jgi:hypothetical protein
VSKQVLKLHNFKKNKNDTRDTYGSKHKSSNADIHTHTLRWRRRAKKQWSFTAQEGVKIEELESASRFTLSLKMPAAVRIDIDLRLDSRRYG